MILLRLLAQKERENKGLLLLVYWTESVKALTSQIIGSWIILARIKHLSLPVFLKWQCLGRISLKNLVQAGTCHDKY